MFLEKRDQYYSKLKEKIEDMVRVNNSKKVVIIAHSLGVYISILISGFLDCFSLCICISIVFLFFREERFSYDVHGT
jgi:hypothetical protein